MCFFFLNGPAPSVIFTLSLHDALPILPPAAPEAVMSRPSVAGPAPPYSRVPAAAGTLEYGGAGPATLGRDITASGAAGGKIGRASCRERVKITEGAGPFKKKKHMKPHVY